MLRIAMQITRYRPIITATISMREDAAGDFVAFADYEKLAWEKATLLRKIVTLRDELARGKSDGAKIAAEVLEEAT